MKNAIVTGATSGIGLEISKVLLSEGYRVFGIGRDFKKSGLKDEYFIKKELDLTDIKAVKTLYSELKSMPLDILVNSAGVGKFGLHEELTISDISNMIDINLKAPLLLSKLFIRKLKDSSGFIFNINSISAIKPATHGCVYGATKAGLQHFGTSLFAESRKYGLKVVNISPDITKTEFFDDKNFTYSSDSECYIEPSDIALVIKDIINLRRGTVVTDIVIQPQKFRTKKKIAKN